MWLKSREGAFRNAEEPGRVFLFLPKRANDYEVYGSPRQTVHLFDTVARTLECDGNWKM